jgi:hypothetical protein
MEENAVPARDPMPALYAALAKAQGEFKPIAKNRDVTIRGRNKHTQQETSYQFRYADLETILAATRPALAANGLALVQPIREDNGGVYLDTMLMHADGGVITSSIPLHDPAAMADLKHYGAEISYLRRYAVTAILGVSADDDLDENGQQPEDEPTGKSKPRSPRTNKPGQKQAPAKQQVEQQVEQQPANPEAPAGSAGLTDGMIKMLHTKLAAADKSVEALLEHFGVAALEDIPRSLVNDAMDWIKS